MYYTCESKTVVKAESRLIIKTVVQSFCDKINKFSVGVLSILTVYFIIARGQLTYETYCGQEVSKTKQLYKLGKPWTDISKQ